MERSRSRSQSFYEDEEDADIDNDNAQQARTPMPDFNMLADMDTEEPPPAPGGDDVDTELDDVDQAQDDRRRSRSFFDQTDVACGLKSALPPPEPTGEKYKAPVRTGKLNKREMEALKEGLTIGGPNSPVSRRDSDLDVDEEYERKMGMVNDTNNAHASTGRDTIVDGSPVQNLFKHVVCSSSKGGGKGGGKTPTAVDPHEKARKIKILMLGDSMVGKTSLMSRWTEDTFNPNLTSTLGVDFKMKTQMIEGHKVQVQVWDTAGQERFRKITKAYYRNAHGIVLVYDCTARESFENITYWMENIQAHSCDGVQVCVVANKIDLREKYHSMGEDLHKLVEREEGEPVATENDVDFYETSAKEKTGVERAFTELIAKVVRAQLEAETEEQGADGNSSAKKKKRFKIKSPKMMKSLVKGSKKMAKQQCVVA